MSTKQAYNHQQQILRAHSDAFRLAESDDFQGWVARKGTAARAIIASGTAQEVIGLLSEYKAAVGLDRQGPAYKREDIATMPADQLEAHLPDILKAASMGRVT